MPLRLIQELDGHFHAIDKLKKHMNTALQLAHITTRLGQARHGRAPSAREKQAQELVKLVEDGYAESAGTIHGYLYAPIIAAIGARLADGLVGPLGWPHTVAIVSSAVSWDLFRLQRLRNLTLITVVLSLLPAAILSGSFTSLIGATFCLYSLSPSFIMYARNDISDRTEVRWTIIGLLVNGLYICTAALLGPIQLTSPRSVIAATFVSLAEFTLLYVVGGAMFNSGPWDPYFKIKYVGNTGRAVQHPLSRIMEASIRFAAQLIVFGVNRIVRFLMHFVFSFDSSALEAIGTTGLDAYQYSRLPDEGSIRLLRILKGRSHQRVQCQFVVHQLGSSELYEAVSYVWGSGSRDCKILLDGSSLEITRSAFNIIRKRRSMWEDKLIWIDQVCINQDDDNEKAVQVKMMSRIYKEASLVAAYLSDQSSSAHHIQLLFAFLHFFMHGLGVPARVMGPIYFLTFRVWRSEAVGDFFGNEWFRRAWIIQEAALASHIHIIYGGICMDWEYLSRAMYALGHREILGALSPSTHESLLAYTLGVRNVDPIMELRGDLKRSGRFDLAHVLTLGNGFKSSDPRDKVYALLGMTRDGAHDSIEPNYHDDCLARDVYRDAMFFILAKNHDPLRVLIRAGIGYERSLQDLPSWVPDWSHDAHLQIIDSIYSAAGSSKPVYKVVSKSRGAISLDGVVLDEVRYVGQPNGRIDEQKDNFQILQWLFAAEQAALQLMRDPYAKEEDFTEAFIRTLLGNHDSYDQRALLERKQCHEYYWVAKRYYETWRARGGQHMPAPVLSSTEIQGGNGGATGFISSMATVDRFLHFAMRSTHTMSFAMTEEDRMAIAPPQSMTGDLICLIKGARRPFVLRRVSLPDQPLEYALVGCCYVHGVMSGELAGRLEDSVPLVIV